jgi:hypothetical protein
VLQGEAEPQKLHLTGKDPSCDISFSSGLRSAIQCFVVDKGGSYDVAPPKKLDAQHLYQKNKG